MGLIRNKNFKAFDRKTCSSILCSRISDYVTYAFFRYLFIHVINSILNLYKFVEYKYASSRLKFEFSRLIVPFLSFFLLDFYDIANLPLSLRTFRNDNDL